MGFKLTTLVVMGTDCIGSCKSNYHMIKITTVPNFALKSNNFLKNVKSFIILVTISYHFGVQNSGDFKTSMKINIF